MKMQEAGMAVGVGVGREEKGTTLEELRRDVETLTKENDYLKPSR